MPLTVSHISSQESWAKISQAMPSTALFGTETQANQPGWRLSPEPYCLTSRQVETLQQIGADLLTFQLALETLYRQSLKTEALSWVKTLFEAGKPETLIQFSQMNRFKKEVPRVLRPDLLVTQDGFSLCEIDAVPGGIGFTAALQNAYQQAGFELVGEPNIANAFLSMLLQDTQKPTPYIAIIVSDEAQDYRPELTWLVSQIQPNYPHIEVIHPKQISLRETELGFINQAGQWQSIDIIYRFFELFDLANIPQMELIQFAVKKGDVKCTPPFKPVFEEKLALALIHHPGLEAFWKTQLTPERLERLQKLIPQTWVLDPSPIPPFAAITPPLQFGDQTFQSFQQLTTLTQKQRELVIKPSGFSPLAWGSRGVTIGHDVPQTEWAQTLESALQQYSQTPHILQRFTPPMVQPYRYFSPKGDIIEAEGRTRLCPYYFITEQTPQLVGILATTCPKDKKVIHGMRDGVMRPVREAPEN